MNDQPTPETDAAEHCVNEIPQFPFVSSNLARRLERERDSLTDQRDFARNIICILWRERDEALVRAENAEQDRIQSDTDSIRALHERNEARRERDEALERADTMFAKHVDILDQARRERDEAQNEIIGWKNKWDCAIEMGARAENALDEAREAYMIAIDQLVVAQSETRKERALADRLAKTSSQE